MDKTTIIIAFIAAVPPTVSSIMWGWVNHSKISTVEKQTNDMNTELRNQRNAASTRADTAEGKLQGQLDERARANTSTKG
jgi:hypothetical protein